MDVVCLGEILIDMFPEEIGRRLVDVSAFHPKPGGAPANVAVAARRLGASSAFIGKIGDDAFGHYLLDVLRDEGVETRGMRVDATARTTLAVIAMPDAHSAEFVFYRNPGADMLLRPDELDEALLRQARALHFGSLSLVAEPSRSATLRAITLAGQAGALLSFDVNYRPSLWPDPATAVEIIRAVLPLAHLVKVNEAELRLLAGRDDPAAGSAALMSGANQVCLVTLGAAGSAFRLRGAEGDEFAAIPAFPVETVDAIGCGDAFMAGVLTRLTAGDGRDWPERLTEPFLRQALRYASAVGALTAQRPGVIPALPTAAEVETFLDRNRNRRTKIDYDYDNDSDHDND
jgi:sugar/nucleoside kinase (ribokinase family)